MTEHKKKRPRLTTAQYAEGRAMAAAGATAKEIAAKFGIQLDAAYRIVRTAFADGDPVKSGARGRSDEEQIQRVTVRADKEIAVIRASTQVKITAIEADRDTKIAAINARGAAKREAAELEKSVADEVAALTQAYEEQVRQAKERAKARVSWVAVATTAVTPAVAAPQPVQQSVSAPSRQTPVTKRQYVSLDAARASWDGGKDVVAVTIPDAAPPIPAAVVTPPTADTATRQAEWDAVKKAPKPSKASIKAIPEPDAVPATAWSLVHDHQLPLRDVANRMGLSKSEVLAALAARKPHIEDRQLARISAMKFSDPD
jgi:hypothetical protein